MRPPALILLFLGGALSQTLSPPVTSKFKCLTNGCCDQHEWCRFWASIGECQSNVEWMSANCQLACGTCSASPPSTPPTSTTTVAATTEAKSAEKSTESAEATSQGAQPPHAVERLVSTAPISKLDPNFKATIGLSKPIGPAAAASDCNAVKSNYLQAAETMLMSPALITANEDTFGRKLLSIDDITRAVPTGCVPQADSETVNCETNLCFHMLYRTLDGTCNNLDAPMRGASFRPFLRHFPSEYDDGKGEPVSSLNVTRPTAREANRIMLSSAQIVVHDKFNNLMMQWGQFMSHDMAKTTLQPSAQCTTCSPVPSKCMPILITDKDPNNAFKQKECLKVSRSAPICNVTPREQLNENTAYIDGSMIYGSSNKDLFKFRDGRSGFLKMSKFNQQNVLPFDQSKCASREKCTASFTAGDIRANLFIGLSSMHILFARQHNRLAKKMTELNPRWSGDRIFQETRKLIGAQIQHVLYKEYLPKLLGSSLDKVIPAYTGYNPAVDSTIANEFTTSAFRFGHGMIEEFYKRLDKSGTNITDGGFFFSDGVFKSGKILFEGGIEPILRGFMTTAVKRPHRMTPAITEKMFGTTDLGSLNIQRGRDHGIPSYNKMRTFCGLQLATSIDELGDMILDKNLRAGLKKNYNTVDDVDFYVGSMLEDPVVGGLVGTTLSCVIGEQFRRTRDGDRFYFENPGIFTPSQLEQIRKTRLSKLICENGGDHFDTIQEDAFLLPGSQLTPCSALPDIDLSAWKE